MTISLRSREFSQADNRERRRRRLTVVLDGGFDLAAEVAEICAPLAEAVAGSPTPHTHRLAMSAVNDAVAEVVFVAVALLAESDAAQRTAHIADLSDLRRAMTMLTDRAQRPAAPVVTLDDLDTGEWSAALVAYASQVSDDLAALLGRAVRPGERRGLDTASERLVDVLRGLDGAAGVVRARRRAGAGGVDLGQHRPAARPRRRAAQVGGWRCDLLGLRRPVPHLEGQRSRCALPGVRRPSYRPRP
ncbi:hypothetical protein QSJ19_22305 [Gordonia sp. ABSL11-1]|uniref:hypothetical protein n=1 Tax=Gordonia sp. ABSL11-1 TaxID=3053924 RepID=UPI002572658E|nr:hypothetical protein [Gordonia sp. ABSL11-1]MDL9948261.1 hypothetical protein [Gordonia sp. ABSL11-1]